MFQVVAMQVLKIAMDPAVQRAAIDLAVKVKAAW